MKCAHTCKAENKPHTCSTSNTCNKSFYKALRHPVAAFHCRPLKNQHRQNAGRPSLVPQKFSSNPGQNSTKKTPIPLFFFWCSSGKLLVDCQITVKQIFYNPSSILLPKHYLWQHLNCCCYYLYYTLPYLHSGIS